MNQQEMEVGSEGLFNYAMKGQWRKVLAVYKNTPEALESKVTKSEDTLLHVAIYVGQTNFVSTLLDNINEEVSLRILRINNSKGNTPLHLAAELGNVELCKAIVTRDPDFVSSRNLAGETPLFLAAHYGKKDAFFCLYGYQKNKEDFSLCRRSNGDTILHSTIYGEYFDLAFQIIQLYPSLAETINEDGVSPLHILAGKPNCFKSSTRMEKFDALIYNCLIVDELTEETEDLSREHRETIEYPKNYGTCMNFLQMLNTILKVIMGTNNDDKAEQDEENVNPSRKCHPKSNEKASNKTKQKKSGRFPPNCETMIRFLVTLMKLSLIILGVGATWIRKIQKKKEKHVWAKQVMTELVKCISLYKYDHSGTKPDQSGVGSIGNYNIHHHHRDADADADEEDQQHKKQRKKSKKSRGTWETPILVAARMGVTEMVEKILEAFPVAIQDVDGDGKNPMLLAIENRQPRVYSVLMKMDFVKESALRHVDAAGNSALHLAAAYKEHKPWRVPGAAMQMQWEYKWYKLVKESMPPNFFVPYNKDGQTAKQLFVKTHAALVKEGSKWLTKTAESCSVVAALVATVAFTTSTAIPGGSNQNTGVPLLQGHPLFNVFTVASLVALCSSVMALVLFLSILTSRFQEKDFAGDLPRKLLVGMSSLFTSITSVLVSFCAGHFFVVETGLRAAVYPIYAATCLPVSFFALVQLPLYLDLMLAIFRKVPQRSYKALSI